MLKEKINALFLKEGDSKKKIENLIFLLVVLVITIIAINYIWKDSSQKKKEDTTPTNKELAVSKEADSENSNLEKRLIL